MLKLLHKINYTKTTAIFVINCFLFSFVYGNVIAEVSANLQAGKQHTQIFNDFILPYSYGKITETNIANSSRVVIQIQDLHCHPQVQKNISNIIELIDKKLDGGLNAIYLEGAYGDIDTSWLSQLRITNDELRINGKDNFNELLDKILKTGRLTGAEYYSALSGKNIIKGLESKEEYLENLKRFGNILESQDEILLTLKGIEESTQGLKKRYYNKKQIKIENLFESYSKHEINARKYYALLLKHIDRLGIDIDKYENTSLYINLIQKEKELNYKNISKELERYVYLLKEKLPYNTYKMILEATNNFNNTEKLYGYLVSLSKELKIDLTAGFPELNKFFAYVEISQIINPIELVNEEQRLRNEINSRFSDTKAQREAVFLIDFEKYLKDYLTSKITSRDHEYYKENIEKYRKLWVKYVDNRVLSLLDEHIKESDRFYDINTDRNKYFVRQLQMNPVPDDICNLENQQGGGYTNSILHTSHPTLSLSELINNLNSKQVDIVITGGFHTEGVSKILKDNGISYIVITPNVTEGVKEAEEVYHKIAKLQSRKLTNSGNEVMSVIANGIENSAKQSSVAADNAILRSSNSKLSSSALANMIASLSIPEQIQIFKFMNVSDERIKELYGDIKLPPETEPSDAAKKAQKIIKLVRGAKLLESDDNEEIIERVIAVINENLPENSSYKDKITTELIENLDLEKVRKALDGNINSLESLLKTAEIRQNISSPIVRQLALLAENFKSYIKILDLSSEEGKAVTVTSKDKQLKFDIGSKESATVSPAVPAADKKIFNKNFWESLIPFSFVFKEDTIGGKVRDGFFQFVKYSPLLAMTWFALSSPISLQLTAVLFSYSIFITLAIAVLFALEIRKGIDPIVPQELAKQFKLSRTAFDPEKINDEIIIYESKTFNEYLREFIEESPDNEFFRIPLIKYYLAVAIQRTIENNFMDLTDENIGAAIQDWIKLYKKYKDVPFIDKNTHILKISNNAVWTSGHFGWGNKDRFYGDALEKVLNTANIEIPEKNITDIKFNGSNKQEMIDAMLKVNPGEKWLFLFKGHGRGYGGDYNFWLGEGDKDIDENENKIHYTEIAKALKKLSEKGVNLDDITLYFASCYSVHGMKGVAYELAKNGLTPPKMFGAADEIAIFNHSIGSGGWDLSLKTMYDYYKTNSNNGNVITWGDLIKIHSKMYDTRINGYGEMYFGKFMSRWRLFVPKDNFNFDKEETYNNLSSYYLISQFERHSVNKIPPRLINYNNLWISSENFIEPAFVAGGISGFVFLMLNSFVSPVFFAGIAAVTAGAAIPFVPVVIYLTAKALAVISDKFKTAFNLRAPPAYDTQVDFGKDLKIVFDETLGKGQYFLADVQNNQIKANKQIFDIYNALPLPAAVKKFLLIITGALSHELIHLSGKGEDYAYSVQFGFPVSGGIAAFLISALFGISLLPLMIGVPTAFVLVGYLISLKIYSGESGVRKVMEKFRKLGIEYRYEKGMLIVKEITADHSRQLTQEDIDAITAPWEIEGNADFYSSKITSLGSLETIGGSVFFENSQITSFGNLETIGGKVYFWNFQITFLGDKIKKIGELNIEAIRNEPDNIKKFKLLDIDAERDENGKLIVKKITRYNHKLVLDVLDLITEDWEIEGEADFYNSQVTSFGNLKNIKGNAYFNHFIFTRLTLLDKLENIGGNVFVNDSKIPSPGNLKTAKSRMQKTKNLVSEFSKEFQVGKNINRIGFNKPYLISITPNIFDADSQSFITDSPAKMLLEITNEITMISATAISADTLYEVIKNAFSHGNNADASKPILIYFNGKNDFFVINEISDEPSLALKASIYNKGWYGRSVGVEKAVKNGYAFSRTDVQISGEKVEIFAASILNNKNDISDRDAIIRKLNGQAEFETPYKLDIADSVFVIPVLNEGERAYYEDFSYTPVLFITKENGMYKITNISGEKLDFSKETFDIKTEKGIDYFITNRHLVKADENTNPLAFLFPVSEVKIINPNAKPESDSDSQPPESVSKVMQKFDELGIEYRYEKGRLIVTEITSEQIKKLSQEDIDAITLPWEIESGADFRNSTITSLGNLESIGGSVVFTYSKVVSLGNLKTIGGNADFSKAAITSLGNLEIIGKNMYFVGSKITSLGKNLKRINKFNIEAIKNEKNNINKFRLLGINARRNENGKLVVEKIPVDREILILDVLDLITEDWEIEGDMELMDDDMIFTHITGVDSTDLRQTLTSFGRLKRIGGDLKGNIFRIIDLNKSLNIEDICGKISFSDKEIDFNQLKKLFLLSKRYGLDLENVFTNTPDEVLNSIYEGNGNFKEIIEKKAKEQGNIFNPQEHNLNDVSDSNIEALKKDLANLMKLFGNTKDEYFVFKTNYTLQQLLENNNIIKLYCDEAVKAIVDIRNDLPSKEQNVKEEMTKMLDKYRYVRGQGFEVELSGRSIDIYNIGKLTGDCTYDGQCRNSFRNIWLMHPDYEVMKLYYNGDFIGYIDYVVGSAGNKKVIIINGHESIPSLQNGTSKHAAVKNYLYLKSMESLMSFASKNGYELMYGSPTNSDWIESIQKEYRAQDVNATIIYPMKTMQKDGGLFDNAAILEELKIEQQRLGESDVVGKKLSLIKSLLLKGYFNTAYQLDNGRIILPISKDTAISIGKNEDEENEIEWKLVKISNVDIDKIQPIIFSQIDEKILKSLDIAAIDIDASRELLKDISQINLYFDFNLEDKSDTMRKLNALAQFINYNELWQNKYGEYFALSGEAYAGKTLCVKIVETVTNNKIYLREKISFEENADLSNNLHYEEITNEILRKKLTGILLFKQSGEKEHQGIESLPVDDAAKNKLKEIFAINNIQAKFYAERHDHGALEPFVLAQYRDENGDLKTLRMPVNLNPLKEKSYKASLAFVDTRGLTPVRDQELSNKFGFIQIQPDGLDEIIKSIPDKQIEVSLRNFEAASAQPTTPAAVKRSESINAILDKNLQTIADMLENGVSPLKIAEFIADKELHPLRFHTTIGVKIAVGIVLEWNPFLAVFSVPIFITMGAMLNFIGHTAIFWLFIKKKENLFKKLKVAESNALTAANPATPAVVSQKIAVEIVSSESDIKYLEHKDLDIEKNMVLVNDYEEAQILQKQGFNAGVASVVTRKPKGEGWRKVQATFTQETADDKEIKISTYVRKNKYGIREISFYSKQGMQINLEAAKEQLEKLIAEGIIDDAFKNIKQVIVTNDITAVSVIDLMKNNHTYSVEENTNERVYDMSDKGTVGNFETVCRKEFRSNYVGIFILNESQIKQNEASIAKLREEGMRFEIKTGSQNFDMNLLTGIDGCQINASEIKTVSEAENLLQRIQKARLSAKDGIYSRITVRFNDDLINELAKVNIDIWKKYSMLPVVNHNSGYKSYAQISFLKDADSAKKVSEALRKENTAAVSVEDTMIFAEIREVIIETKKARSSKQLYKKGYAASLNSKFDYTAGDIISLKELLTEDLTDNDKAKAAVENMTEKGLSGDSMSYLNYLKSKGQYVEAIGFIRGIAANSVRKEIFETSEKYGAVMDMEKFRKDDKFRQAFLTIAIQLKLQGQDIKELLKEDSSALTDMNAAEYLNLMTAMINRAIEDILAENEYAVKPLKAEETAAAIDIFKNFNALFQDRFRIIETAKQLKVSTSLAVRSILSAA